MAEYMNSGLLRIARQRLGLAQGEAAERLPVPQVTLSRYENAVAAPPDEFIARAAMAHDMPIEFFRQTDAVFGPPVSVHPMWRKKADVTVREIDKIIAEINIRALQLRRLLNGVEYAPQSISRASIWTTMTATLNVLQALFAPIGCFRVAPLRT
jgi:transcriptional regulator with XRE-family HTH domain